MNKTALFVALICLLTISIGCKNVAKYAIDSKPTIKTDPNMYGIWKMIEDTDKHNYFVITQGDNYRYNITYMNRGGDNRTYENFPLFFSDVNGTKFINIGYSDGDRKINGYFFLKVISIDKGDWDITAAMVADTTLYDIANAAGVRNRIMKHLNDPSFYKDTVHFIKKLPINGCICK